MIFRSGDMNHRTFHSVGIFNMGGFTSHYEIEHCKRCQDVKLTSALSVFGVSSSEENSNSDLLKTINREMRRLLDNKLLTPQWLSTFNFNSVIRMLRTAQSGNCSLNLNYVKTIQSNHECVVLCRNNPRFWELEMNWHESMFTWCWRGVVSLD